MRLPQSRPLNRLFSWLCGAESGAPYTGSVPGIPSHAPASSTTSEISMVSPDSRYEFTWGEFDPAEYIPPGWEVGIADWPTPGPPEINYNSSQWTPNILIQYLTPLQKRQHQGTTLGNATLHELGHWAGIDAEISGDNWSNSALWLGNLFDYDITETGVWARLKPPLRTVPGG